MNSEQIIVYTDGSSLGNPGPGGWAFVISNDEKTETASGGYRKTTNNRMEYLAVIKALKYLIGTKKEVVIHTDSQLLFDTMTKWVFGWQKKNWKKTDNKPIQNLDLVQELFELSKSIKVKWKKVAAHVGIELNELCDTLAREAANGAIDIDFAYEQIPSDNFLMFAPPIVKVKNNEPNNVQSEEVKKSKKTKEMNNNELIHKDILIENDKLLIYIFNSNGTPTLELKNKNDASRSSLFEITKLPEFLITILKNADG